MRKTLALAAFVTLLSANAFATYIVVLKNGTTYKAKAKWTVSNGKALVNLESGQSLQLDPSLIDEARSEQATRSGLGDARIIAVQPAEPSAPQTQTSALGSSVHLRKLPPGQVAPPTPAPTTPTPAPAVAAPAVSASGQLSQEVVDKFAKAYENVGLFEQKLTATGPHSLRAELTADTEDKVFNAISATSFLMVRNAGVTGAQIDLVELFMKTTTGGSSGRFQMTREDAAALDTHQLTLPEYFVRKVIY